MSARLAAFVALSVAAIFALAVRSAATRWRSYQRSRDDWSSTTCVVADEDPVVTKEPETSFKCGGDFPFAALVRVKEVDDPGNTVEEFVLDDIADAPISVFMNSEACAFKTEDEAKKFADKYTAGAKSDCYTNGRFVRLTAGGFSAAEIRGRRLNAIFSIIATILVGCFMLWAVYYYRPFPRAARRREHPPYAWPSPSPLASAPRAAGPSPTLRRPLSVSDTRLLVASLPEGHDGGTCAICLEDFADNARKARRLPCLHAYHEECALQWFRKGTATCPYCNHDLGDEVRRLREEEHHHHGAAPRDGIEGSSGSSGTLEAGYLPLQWNRRPSPPTPRADPGP